MIIFLTLHIKKLTSSIVRTSGRLFLSYSKVSLYSLFGLLDPGGRFSLKNKIMNANIYKDLAINTTCYTYCFYNAIETIAM